MYTYVLLKTGEIMILWSDNDDIKTVHLFDLDELDELGNYDADWLNVEEYPYSCIYAMNRDLDHLKSLKIGATDQYMEMEL